MHVERPLGSDRTIFSTVSTASQMSSACFASEKCQAERQQRPLSKGSNARSVTSKSFVKVPNLNISGIYAKQLLKGREEPALVGNTLRGGRIQQERSKGKQPQAISNRQDSPFFTLRERERQQQPRIRQNERVQNQSQSQWRNQLSEERELTERLGSALSSHHQFPQHEQDNVLIRRRNSQLVGQTESDRVRRFPADNKVWLAESEYEKQSSSRTDRTPLISQASPEESKDSLRRRIQQLQSDNNELKSYIFELQKDLKIQRLIIDNYQKLTPKPQARESLLRRQVELLKDQLHTLTNNFEHAVERETQLLRQKNYKLQNQLGKLQVRLHCLNSRSQQAKQELQRAKIVESEAAKEQLTMVLRGYDELRNQYKSVLAENSQLRQMCQLTDPLSSSFEYSISLQ